MQLPGQAFSSYLWIKETALLPGFLIIEVAQPNPGDLEIPVRLSEKILESWRELSKLDFLFDRLDANEWNN